MQEHNLGFLQNLRVCKLPCNCKVIHGKLAGYQLVFFQVTEWGTLTSKIVCLLKGNSDTHFLTAVFFMQVDTIHNGLDRCAALLKNILQNEATGCTY